IIFNLNNIYTRHSRELVFCYFHFELFQSTLYGKYVLAWHFIIIITIRRRHRHRNYNHDHRNDDYIRN
ncbi:hypothetical protein M5D96_013527, partial [Drosophila gunungcola]